MSNVDQQEFQSTHFQPQQLDPQTPYRGAEGINVKRDIHEKRLATGS